jgi:hypothetical protein
MIGPEAEFAKVGRLGSFLRPGSSECGRHPIAGTRFRQALRHKLRRQFINRRAQRSSLL